MTRSRGKGEGVVVVARSEGLLALGGQIKADPEPAGRVQVNSKGLVHLQGMGEEGGSSRKGLQMIQNASGVVQELVWAGGKRGALTEVKMEAEGGSDGSSLKARREVFTGPVFKKARHDKDDLKHGAPCLLALALVAQREQQQLKQQQQQKQGVSIDSGDHRPNSDCYESPGDNSSREHSLGGEGEGEGCSPARSHPSQIGDVGTCRLACQLLGIQQPAGQRHQMRQQQQQQQQQEPALGGRQQHQWVQAVADGHMGARQQGGDGKLLPAKGGLPVANGTNEKQPLVKKTSWVSD
jgi:hypothetical protein